jgi:hypothetical protein
MLPQVSPLSMIGKAVSHDRIIETLAGDGRGVVCSGHDRKLRCTVALKFLPGRRAQDLQALERLQREARAASALEFPFVCSFCGRCVPPANECYPAKLMAGSDPPGARLRIMVTTSKRKVSRFRLFGPKR